MKKTTATATETFSEKVTEKVEIKFTKVVTAKNRTFFGKIFKDEAQVGHVSHDKADNHVTVQVKPFDAVTPEEFSAIYNALPACVAELTAE